MSNCNPIKSILQYNDLHNSYNHPQFPYEAHERISVIILLRKTHEIDQYSRYHSLARFPIH
ncbi:unnamed protein product [Periconia digitata]|uniref:Uncharacterized protein n=1 Tax=Periconia digitata TaxID=1303443 RepID=A0A9W4UC58_9PLEO|nr:unnamed protein product [Periconia digitata]